MGAGEGGFGFGAGESSVEDFAAKGFGAGGDEDESFVILAALGFMDGEAVGVIEGEGEGGDLAGRKEDVVRGLEIGEILADEEAGIAVEELEVGGVACDDDGGGEPGALGNLVEKVGVDGVDAEGTLAHAGEDGEFAEVGQELLGSGRMEEGWGELVFVAIEEEGIFVELDPGGKGGDNFEGITLFDRSGEGKDLFAIGAEASGEFCGGVDVGIEDVCKDASGFDGRELVFVSDEDETGTGLDGGEEAGKDFRVDHGAFVDKDEIGEEWSGVEDRVEGA